MSDHGFIQLYRNYFKNPLWEEPRVYSRAEAWLDLIQWARFDESKVSINGRMVVVQRGQIVTATRFIASRWKWSTTKVIAFLGLLENEKMIEQKKDAQKTTITLCNFDKYNGLKNAQKDAEKTQKKRRKDAEKTNYNKDNNYNNDNTTSTLTGVGVADGVPPPPSPPNPLESAFAEFQKWIKEHAPRVAKMKEPFTITQYRTVKNKFSPRMVADTLKSMHNYEPLFKNRSANLTLQKWANKDLINNSRTDEKQVF